MWWIRRVSPSPAFRLLLHQNDLEDLSLNNLSGLVDYFSAANIHYWVQCILDPVLHLRIPIQDSHGFQLFAMIMLSLDSIWRTRNQSVREGSWPNPLALAFRILKLHREHKKAWTESSRVPKHINANNFAMGDFSKLTFDVAVRPLLSTAAAVLFHSDGHILRAWSSSSREVDPSIGKATAAYLALPEAKEASLSNLILADDSSIVLENLQAAGKLPSLPWRIASLILSSVELIGSFSCFSCIKLPRSENFGSQCCGLGVFPLFCWGGPPSFLLHRGLWKYNSAKLP